MKNILESVIYIAVTKHSGQYDKGGNKDDC